MKNQLAATIAITAAALLTPSAAHAVSTTILQPISVTSSVGEFSGSFTVNNIINQSGLQPGYTSGETNFSEVTNIRHDSSGSLWLGDGQRGVLTFDLGNSRTIQGMALWSVTSSAAIQSFELYADVDNIFNNGNDTQLQDSSGSTIFSARRPPSFQAISAQTYSFTPTQTQFVNLNILSIDLASQERSPAVAEIAFEQSATSTPFEFGPMPGIIFLVAVGGMNYFRNTKRGGKDSDQ